VIAWVGIRPDAKVTFANLLAARRVRESHRLDPDRIGEIGERGIVEREVSVLAVTERTQIGGVRAQRLRVIATRSLNIFALTLNRIECLRRDVVEDMLA